MTTKTKRPEPGSIEDLKQKADEVLAWKASAYPNAPTSLKGFAYYFAGHVAETNHALYDQHAKIAELWAEGEALWWRTIAHVRRYEAELEAERQRSARLCAEYGLRPPPQASGKDSKRRKAA